MDRVYFPGQVNFAGLPGYYRSSSLYLSASHSDGTSISLLEALGCGCPVLVSDIPGNREWITPGKQGWLFADGDVDSLTRGLLEILKNRECLPQVSLAARELAEQRADWEVNFPKLLKAYAIAVDY
jgi:glycosyltransferase involved in cell wall biosynthesis